MKKKILSVAILGVGSRGGNAYGSEMHKQSDKFKITAICDVNKEKLKHYGELLQVDEANRFDSEDAFFAERRADALIICTFDNMHADECVRAFELGYDVLLEKPVASKREDCLRIIEAQEKYGRRATVCHVLRYSPIYEKVDELIRDGKIGRLVHIEASEPVNYWHFSHSFVRGNSGSTERAAPMLISKCCHDLDLIAHYAGAECDSVSSIGSLSFFTPLNAPDGSADRCVDCKLIDDCPYSAKKLYIERWHRLGSPINSWPTAMLATAPITEEKLLSAIEKGPYGRCVFRCGNNACDNQTVHMSFKNGVKASFCVTAFNEDASRRYIFHGTYGAIELTADAVTLREYGNEPVIYPVSDMVKAGEEHGGGDVRLIYSFYRELMGEEKSPTALENSMEGYLIAAAAEESRMCGGISVRVRNEE